MVRFSKEKKDLLYKKVLILSEVFLVQRRFREVLEMSVGIYVKYPLFLSDLMKLGIFPRISIEYSYEMSWKSVRWDPRYSTPTDGRTDRLTDICSFSNAPINAIFL